MTLPAPPVPITLPVDALPRWLRARGWVKLPALESWLRFSKDDESVQWCVPNDALALYADVAAEFTKQAIVNAARIEGIEPTALAAELLALDAPPSADGPPVQWEHLSAGQRQGAIATLRTEALFLQQQAEEDRTKGYIEAALRSEGGTMALQALASLPARLDALAPVVAAAAGWRRVSERARRSAVELAIGCANRLSYDSAGDSSEQGRLAMEEAEGSAALAELGGALGRAATS